MKTLEQLALEAGLSLDQNTMSFVELRSRPGSAVAHRLAVSPQALARFRSLCRAEDMEEAAQIAEGARIPGWVETSADLRDGIAAAIREQIK